MFVLKFFGINAEKDALYVTPPLGVVQVSLSRVFHDAFHHVSPNGKAGRLRNAFSQPFALVITSLALPSWGKWNRQQCIDAIEEISGKQILRHHPAKKQSYLRLFVIFERK